MRISPDELILWQHGFVKLNSTIVTSWGLMLMLTLGAIAVTRRLGHTTTVSPWQSFLEIVVTGINTQIKEVGLPHPENYIGFIGTLFLFIGMSSICTIIPGYETPTGSLSTTVALALCVFIAVPIFGIAAQGVGGYLASYVHPTFVMLPFNIISEFSRTLAMAVRLFGNMMSGGMIVGILLSITPFLFPIVMTVLGLLTGMVQAYIFSILATVYIAGAVRARKSTPNKLEVSMDSMTLIAIASIVTAGITTCFGCLGPALGEGYSVATALRSLAQQPDASATITRTLFVGLAMIESTAIYCFVVSMILIFANPFWNHAITAAGH